MFNFKNPFKMTEKQLEDIAWNVAERRFGITNSEGNSYITFDGNKVSTEEDAKDKAKLIDRLHEYREMFVAEFVANGGER